jgi:ribonuclease HI
LDFPTFKIVFDGGALGNPGKGYGSFHISGPGGYVVHERRDYPGVITNNQAEYMTLIEALQLLVNQEGPATRQARLVINGDSLLVINQLLGKWKVKNAGLQPLHRQAGMLLQKFGTRELNWHDRSNSVALLGH